MTLIHATKSLHPWRVGSHEGRFTSEVLGDLKDRIENRPHEPVPGRADGSTEEGESFNAFKGRTISHAQGQIARWTPGRRILNVTHYRPIRVIESWLKNGAPDDQTIDTKEMLQKGNSKPGDLFRLDPRKLNGKTPAKLEKVQNTAKDGIFYLRHGATALNEENKATQGS